MSDSNTITDNSAIRSISEELYKKNKEINETLLETKQLAADLTEEKKKIEIILENIIDIVVYVDENEKILIVNKAFERDLGILKQESLGKKLADILKFEDDAKALTLNELYQLADKQVQETKITKSLKIRGKKSIFGTIGLSAVSSEENKRRTIITIHDKTKEHELENMKLDFVSMAAHELRTPITSIRGYASLMSEEISAHEHLPIDDWKLLLGRISISSEQLLALVENLLNVTKIEKGIMSLACRSEDWKTCIEEVLSVFEDHFKSKQMKLSLDYPDKPLRAYVDKMRIQEVLNNLLSNAINYTPPGSTVTITVTTDEQFIHTTVADNGPGIPKQAQKHLFEKFFRVSGPLEQGSKGNGLGLYISKSIVEMHGGKIWVDSDTGQGARFTFTVPLLEQ